MKEKVCSCKVETCIIFCGTVTVTFLSRDVFVLEKIYFILLALRLRNVDTPLSLWSLLFSHSVAVTRSRDVPSFGPPIPKGVTFPKSNVFRDFLLAKVINAENAAHQGKYAPFPVCLFIKHLLYVRPWTKWSLRYQEIEWGLDSCSQVIGAELCDEREETKQPSYYDTDMVVSTWIKSHRAL